jgi:hypothetical protein
MYHNFQACNAITGRRAAPTTANITLHGLDFPSQVFLRFAELLLKSSEQLILFAFGEREVVIAQLRVFLFQFAFHFVPTAFESQFCHSDKYFACGSAIGRLTMNNALKD